MVAVLSVGGVAEAKKKKGKKSCPAATVSYIPVRFVTQRAAPTKETAGVQQQSIEVQQAAPAAASVQQMAAPAKASASVQQQAAPAKSSSTAQYAVPATAQK